MQRPPHHSASRSWWARLHRCEKRHFLRHSLIKTIILPRQARDKHRGNTPKKERFSTGAGQYAVILGQHKLLLGGGGLPNTWYHDGCKPCNCDAFPIINRY